MSRVDIERDYWDKAALDPDVDEKYISDVSTEEMIEALGAWQNMDDPALEIGCGVGRIASELWTYHKVWGIDISQRMIDIATERRQECSDRSCENVYVVNDGRTIPLASNFFGFAYCVLVFQHLKDDAIANYLIQVNRVLKPNGVFRFQFIQGTEKEPFSNHYSLEQIKIWCDMAGLKIEKIDEGLVHPQWTWITARKPNV